MSTSQAEPTDDLGLREHWESGSTAYFEYHCYEGHDSADAEAWYRSHQTVTVLAPGTGDGWDWDTSTLAERAAEGVPRTYRVRWADGFEYDAWEDELLTDPSHYYRPAPPPRGDAPNGPGIRIGKAQGHG